MERTVIVREVKKRKKEGTKWTNSRILNTHAS